MTPPTAEISTDLPCHRCGYDLRAHPPDGKCPECEASVAESRRLAGIPFRPAWRNTDPRWRRRMLAGTWILVLLPLMNALQLFGWASRLSVPTLIQVPGASYTLDESFLFNFSVYQPLLVCIGVVLLFSKERGRRHSNLDWTRRWGVFCAYVILLLSTAPILFITALVLAGIAALFMSMPLKYQPGATPLFAKVGAAYMRYGPQPKDTAGIVLVAFSSIAILLACIPLFNALRSSGPKRLAAIVIAPLALFSLVHLAEIARYYVGFSSRTSANLNDSEWYFRPDLLVRYIADVPASLFATVPSLSTFLMELAKWCIVLAIAMWLTIAQFAAWRHRKSHQYHLLI